MKAYSVKLALFVLLIVIQLSEVLAHRIDRGGRKRKSCLPRTLACAKPRSAGPRIESYCFGRARFRCPEGFSFGPKKPKTVKRFCGAGRRWNAPIPECNPLGASGESCFSADIDPSAYISTVPRAGVRVQIRSNWINETLGGAQAPVDHANVDASVEVALPHDIVGEGSDFNYGDGTWFTIWNSDVEGYHILQEVSTERWLYAQDNQPKIGLTNRKQDGKRTPDQLWEFRFKGDGTGTFQLVNYQLSCKMILRHHTGVPLACWNVGVVYPDQFFKFFLEEGCQTN